MKIWLILLLILPAVSFGQNSIGNGHRIIPSDSIVAFPHVEAEFPGGWACLIEFIEENLDYPEITLCPIQGRVFLRLTIEIDGSISEIEVMRALSEEYDQAALACVEKMPTWNSARMDGQEAVRSQINIPVRFRLH